MRRSGSLVGHRRKAIIDYLTVTGRCRIADLAVRFGVSPLTIRRDLDELEGQGVVHRSYGIAEIADPLGSPISSRMVMAKRSIARAAAQLVEDGDTVFVNTSSTALAVLEHIRAENVTIVTNNGKALQARPSSSISVILTGGEIRLPKWSMAGEFALDSISKVSAAKAILGCSGLSAEEGLTTLVSHETSINALMLERSERHIIVADSGKLGANSSFCYGSPSQVDTLVTDASANPSLLESLLDAGVDTMMRVEVQND